MTSQQERPFLSFYEKHAIIPTREVFDDRERFFRQRDYLLQTLGIVPSLLRGSRILEIGPGTGQKAQHLLARGPELYVAVDGNPESLRMTTAAIEECGFGGVAEVRKADFMEFEEERKYDLVLAEAVVPTQADPFAFLQRMKSHVSDGGIMVYTCMDSVSLLPEVLRRAIVRDLSLYDGDLNTSAERIAAFFETDLDALPGMTRLRKDWAIDQMIHPWSGPLLNIPTSLASLGSGVDFLGSSPRLSGDWRWYKDAEVLGDGTVTWAVTNFWALCHNLVDKRVWHDPRSASLNVALYEPTDALYDVVMNSSWTPADRESVEMLARLALDRLPPEGVETRESLEGFLRYWRTGRSEDLDVFRPWWGRGQQFVSVVSHGAASSTAEPVVTHPTG